MKKAKAKAPTYIAYEVGCTECGAGACYPAVLLRSADLGETVKLAEDTTARLKGSGDVFVVELPSGHIVWKSASE